MKLNFFLQFVSPVTAGLMVGLMLLYPNPWVISTCGVCCSVFSYCSGWWRGYDRGFDRGAEFKKGFYNENP